MNTALPIGQDDRESRRAFLTLRERGARYALPIDCVRSVFRLGRVTRAPRAPSHVIGLANPFGAAMAVVSLARRLEPELGERETSSLAIALVVDDQTFALAVESVEGVIHSPQTGFAAAPGVEDPEPPGLLEGLVRHDDGSLWPILRPLRLLALSPRGGDVASRISR